MTMMSPLEHDLNRLAAVDLSAIFDLTLIEQAAKERLALADFNNLIYDRMADRLDELINTFGGLPPPPMFLKGYAAGMVSYGLETE